MILFSVGSDSDTVISESVIAIQKSTNALSRQKHAIFSISVEQIQRFIAEGPERKIIFVSHGSQVALLDASSRRVPYLTADDAESFKDYYLLAHACSSGAHLGREIIKYAILYVGFDSYISAPPSAASPCYGDILSLYQIMLSYFESVEIRSSVEGKADAIEFLRGIKEHSSCIELRFDTPVGSTLGAEELICIRQFREDISVWVRGLNEMIKCEGARLNALLW
jgi:hypothetical protein